MFNFGDVREKPLSESRDIDSRLPPDDYEMPLLAFPGTDVYGRRNKIGFSERVLDKNMFLVGGIGSGKTNIIAYAARRIIDRLERHPDEKIVILDVKGDYSDMMRHYRGNVQRCVRCFGINDYDNCWNIFFELTAFGSEMKDIEIRANEISKYLFSGQKSPNAPYFAEAASILFKCLLVYMIRRASETGDFSRLNNACLKEELANLDMDGWLKILNSYEDFKSAASCLCNGEFNTESSGVLSEIAVMKDNVFNGAFAEKGDFSLAEFVRSREGGILILRSDMSMEKTTLPVLSCMLDNAFKALAAYGEKCTPVTFILDEFGRLPRLQYLEMALSLLRSRHIHFIVGLQTVGQTERQTNEINGKCLLDLMLNVILLRSDAQTVKYIRERFGDTKVTVYTQLPDGSQTARTEFRPVIETEDVHALRDGEAFVKMDNFPKVFKFRFDNYSALKVL